MISKAIQKCLKNNVKVYPVFDKGWYVEAIINGRKKRFDKKLQQKEVNEAITKTYQFLASKL